MRAFYALTNDNATADATFHRAIAVNGASALAHYEYGKYLVQTNRADAAENEFQMAVQVDPNNREARFVLASFYLVNKRFAKAEEAYKALAELDKDKPEGRSVLGDFYGATGRLDEAIAIYKEVITKSPDYTQGHYRLAELMLNHGDIANAKAEVDAILKKDAKDRQAMILRARIEMQGANPNDLKAAIADLQEVHEAGTEFTSRFVLHGRGKLPLRPNRSSARLRGRARSQLSRLPAGQIDAGADQSGERRREVRFANLFTVTGSNHEDLAGSRHVATDAG